MHDAVGVNEPAPQLRVRLLNGALGRTRLSEAGAMMAAPSPWKPRATISAEALKATPAARLAKVKMTIPMSMSRRRP